MSINEYVYLKLIKKKASSNSTCDSLYYVTNVNAIKL